MLRKFYLLAATFIIGSGFAAMAQTGEIKGKVLDKATNEPLPFANVIVEIGGTQAGGAQTDFDGNFTIKPLSPGRYSLKSSFVGYSAAEVTGVLVSTDKITFQNLSMTKGAVDITAVTVTAYSNPLIDKGNPSTQTTVTQEEIKVAPTRDVKSVASTTAGVYQKDEGDDLNVRGSRSNATDYYIDGIKVRGSTNLPQSGIEQITVVTGGVPAQYGDATGGIINITTRGPSKDFFGGIEFATSELFDQYGYNLIGANISGPIWSRKNAEGKVDRTVIGFFFSGEYQLEKDPDPSAIGMFKVKDDLYNDIKRNPLSTSTGTGTVYRNKTEFLRADDFEKIKYKQNTAAASYRASGKIDIQPADNLTISIGGSIDHKNSNDYIHTYSLYNYDNNPQRIADSWRVFGRLTQRLGGTRTGTEASSSIIKNAYYSLQVDYSRNKTVVQDEDHEDRFFDYGYIGRFDILKRQGLIYSTPSIDPITGDTAFTMFHPDGTGIFFMQAANPGDSLVQFTPGGVNTITEAYTQQYFNLSNNDGPVGNFQNLSQINTNGGILNGQLPRNTYSLWRSPGYTYPQRSFSENTQFRISAHVSADIKDHAISAGFEYEQRSDRSFVINPVGLWGLMRLRANENNLQLDLANPIYINSSTVHYNRRYSNSTGLPGFFENLRARLASAGYSNVSNIDFVNIDNVNKDDLSLDLFTAEELLNSGNNLILYSGYDYDGERSTGSVSFEDFWTARDQNGNFSRPVGAFEPIYMAGYIQDKFAINDLIFNIGVRVDRFDANQKVLKDKYLLYPARTAGQVAPNRPSNIGDDFVVYVNDVRDPENASIVGYRDEDVWYDVNGSVVINPLLLAQQAGGVIAPWLVTPSLAEGGVQTTSFKPSDSFEDYEPSITVMPRVAFSFPISDEALFFAHYDVLTQRPPSRLRNNPLDYYYIESQGALLNNPNLKPERTVDYELGFKQTLSKSSAITISGFYRELRDNIQQTKVNFAFPKEYLSFDNIDFGTVKGLSIGYDMRRTGNVRLTANYTLQFADGTGSADRTADRLLQTGQPNLRTIAPLDYDQRHAITVSVDYRYTDGKDYNGPMIKNTQVFANTGMNVVLRTGSGTPYSRFRDVRTEANNIGLQQIGAGQLDGEINGSRLPWQFRVDAKLDRDFKIKFGKSEGAKMAMLNIYVLVQNVFNTKNIITVYQYTGNPDDDGYLASAEGQSFIPLTTDPVAFVDQYNIKINNPNNYSLPRRARIGVKLDF